MNALNPNQKICPNCAFIVEEWAHICPKCDFEWSVIKPPINYQLDLDSIFPQHIVITVGLLLLHALIISIFMFLNSPVGIILYMLTTFPAYLLENIGLDFVDHPGWFSWANSEGIIVSILVWIVIYNLIARSVSRQSPDA